MTETTLSRHDLLVVAVRAHVDPRTVRSYLNGRTTLPATARVVAQAIRELEAERGDRVRPCEHCGGGWSEGGFTCVCCFYGTVPDDTESDVEDRDEDEGDE